MGNTEIRNRLWDSITANDSETLRGVLKKYPDYINKPISSDGKTIPLTRAAYLNRPHIISVLYSLGADINLTGNSGITGLMWAAAKGNVDSLEILIQCKADLNKTGPFEMTALDFAILYGSYKTAFILWKKDCRATKSPYEYLQIKKKMNTVAVNYEDILLFLQRETLPREAPRFIAGAFPELRSADFRDPSETGGSEFYQVSEPDIRRDLNQDERRFRNDLQEIDLE